MASDLFDIDKAWDLLAKIEGNPVCECRHTGETWQYIGEDENGLLFEHLHHPVTKRRQTILFKNGKVVCNS